MISELTADLDTAINQFDDFVMNDDKIMLYFTSDIPLEIITAAGYVPVRIPAEIKIKSQKMSPSSVFQPFICSKSQQMVNFLINTQVKSAIFSENHCDSLQNLYDVLLLNNVIPDDFNYFRFLLPVNRGGDAATDYYFKELKRFIYWFEDLIGNKITNESLKRSISLHNMKRTKLNILSEMIQNGEISNHEYFKIKIATDLFPLEKSIDELENIISKRETLDHMNKQNRIILSGSMFDNFSLFEKIPLLDKAVIDNDLTFGSRTSTFQIDTSGKSIEESLKNIAKAYIKHKIPDSVHFYPNKRRDDLLEKIEKTDAQGIIFIYYSFCDPDAFETRNLSRFFEEKKGIPVLTLVTDPQLTNIEQLSTRVEAFLEKVGGLN